MPPLFQTRAQAMGIKPKILAARTAKNISFVRERLMKLAEPWADIDNGIEGALSDLLAQLTRSEDRADRNYLCPLKYGTISAFG